jgi:uncharacterized paraquat-inducible protein A
MQRCEQCDGVLTKSDATCVRCGEAVKAVRTKPDLRQRFGKLVTVVFILSAVLTVVALFTNYVGSFVTCLGATIALLMVKKSADEISSSQK